MRRQDLLDQGRSSPRHADNENRVPSFAPTWSRKHFRIEDFDGAVDESSYLVSIERMVSSAKSVALRIVGKRLVAAAEVMERLAQCELEVEAIIVFEAVS